MFQLQLHSILLILEIIIDSLKFQKLIEPFPSGVEIISFSFDLRILLILLSWLNIWYIINSLLLNSHIWIVLSFEHLANLPSFNSIIFLTLSLCILKVWIFSYVVKEVNLKIEIVPFPIEAYILSLLPWIIL